MSNNHSSKWLISLFAISCKWKIDFYFEVKDVNLVLVLSVIEGKGFSGGRGSSFKGGSKGTGTFGGPSSYSRANNYGSNVGQP